VEDLLLLGRDHPDVKCVCGRTTDRFILVEDGQCKEGELKIEKFLENVIDKFIWCEMWAAPQVIILGRSH